MKKNILFLTIIGFFVSSALAAPHAFPVPYVEKNHNRITFRDLPTNGTIKVFTIAGEEVINLNIPQGLGLLNWDVKNTSGKKLASGVYFFLVNGDGQKTTGKLVVIR